MHKPYRSVIIITIAALLTGCATRTIEPFDRPVPEYAMAPQSDTPFDDIESAIRAAHGSGYSGFKLLDSNEDGLRWRLTMIDAARYSIDAQYYLWYGDAAGRIVAKHLLDAAARGVKVRVIVDDLNTLLRDAGTLDERDEVAAWLDAHPNLELRLFNPWSKRQTAARFVEGLGNFKKVNQRMHNKALIVDNQAVIAGGRNIGDEYMGLNADFNFHDLDVLGIGPVARQASAVFDAFWNSDWVLPAAALDVLLSDAEIAASDKLLVEKIEETESLAAFVGTAQPGPAVLASLVNDLHAGTAEIFSDQPAAGTIEHVMLRQIYSMLESAQRETLIINAYVILADRGVQLLRELNSRGVEVTILTNSLASHDVPAVNSHYKKWRKPILETGAELYEIRSDAGIKALFADTPPTRSGFMGLHSKAMVIDRERVYIGSMNFDPRSAAINSEMGVFIDSRGLAEALAQLIERDIGPENSWQVTLTADGRLRWSNDSETVSRQPARNWWQRVEDLFFMMAPREYY